MRCRERGLGCQPAEQRERAQGARHGDQQSLADVPQLEMPELMGQHRLDFRVA